MFCVFCCFWPSFVNHRFRGQAKTNEWWCSTTKITHKLHWSNQKTKTGKWMNEWRKRREGRKNIVVVGVRRRPYGLHSSIGGDGTGDGGGERVCRLLLAWMDVECGLMHPPTNQPSTATVGGECRWLLCVINCPPPPRCSPLFSSRRFLVSMVGKMK